MHRWMFTAGAAIAAVSAANGTGSTLLRSNIKKGSSYFRSRLSDHHEVTPQGHHSFLSAGSREMSVNQKYDQPSTLL
jgi:hypothetical protein